MTYGRWRDGELVLQVIGRASGSQTRPEGASLMHNHVPPTVRSTNSGIGQATHVGRASHCLTAKRTDGFAYMYD
jgi:hypothetical protein